MLTRKAGTHQPKMPHREANELTMTDCQAPGAQLLPAPAHYTPDAPLLRLRGLARPPMSHARVCFRAALILFPLEGSPQVSASSSLPSFRVYSIMTPCQGGLLWPAKLRVYEPPSPDPPVPRL